MPRKVKVKKQKLEKAVQLRLAKALNGQVEVHCNSGIIDILTDSQVIEVKKIKCWKAAVGQALVYQLDFPLHTPRIHLFGNASDRFRKMVILFTARLGIITTFEPI